MARNTCPRCRLGIVLPVLQVWLGYAPGGVETTALLAMSLGLDAAFVSSHHIMRVVILNLLVPFWVAPFMKKREVEEEADAEDEG